MPSRERTCGLAQSMRGSAKIGDLPEATLSNSAAYLANWLAALRSDSRMVLPAAGQAQKAADLILVY